jgi:basic membrane lipoprotein Med (substrate-binding protein (PBP1-ABC) superfamily)
MKKGRFQSGFAQNFSHHSRGPLVLAAIVLALSLPACREQASEPGARNEFKVALLTPGPVSDAGWNAAAFDGLRLIEAELGARTGLVQTTSPADFEDAFRDFASRGFDLIFAHGFEYTDAALKVAKHFPDTTFVVTSGSAEASNVASLSFKVEEAAYVEGVLSGAMTRTGVVGAVGGIELPSIRLAFEGYRRGFLSVRPDGRVLMSFVGSFEDVGAAKEAALAQIRQGADLLYHNADAAGLGVFQAAQQAKAYAFGVIRDQNDVAPDAVLASGVTDIPGGFLRIASEVRAGTFQPRMIEYGMKDGMVKVVFNPALLPRVPKEALARSAAAEQAIIAEQVELPTLATGGRPAD